MLSYFPSKIYIEDDVRELPITKRIMDLFPAVPQQTIAHVKEIKEPLPITEAKKILVLARHRDDPVKSCQGMGNTVCCQYLTVSFVSNCHYECSYCILQDYLKNNPVMTIFVNTDEILEWIEKRIDGEPDHLFRLGTGELSDSLALDPLTGFSEILVPFAAVKKNLVLEFKTKSAEVDRLLDLDHGGKTVVSWSLNPQNFIDQEEYKCASLEERLQAARKVADAGYPVGFHFDPLLALENWEEEYEGLIKMIEERFRPAEIAWISLGSLRFTPGLKKIMGERFPKSRLLLGELFPGADGKIRYLRDIRQELYRHVKRLIDDVFPNVPNYLCMETGKVWDKVYRHVPSSQAALEERLVARFAL